VVVKFDAVLVGAGISIGAPAHLPDGDELSALAWRTLASTFDARVAEQLRAVRGSLRQPVNGERGVRLEQLLEVLSGAIPLRTLVGVYEVLDTARWNGNHAALARLELDTVFTVNMDTLLERAFASHKSGTDVVHLHGVWDQPSTIVTTIGQYLDGLDPAVERQFATGVESKRLLVMGYSGRDRDLTTALRRHAPATLTWLALDPKSLTEEAVRLLADLTALGTLVELVYGTAEAYLTGLLARQGVAYSDSVPFVDPRARRSRRWTVPKRVRERFAEIPLERRVFAVTLLMLELGLNREIVEVLRAFPITGDLAIRARKQLSRAYRRLGRTWAAVRMLLQPPLDPRKWREWLNNANELAAALPRVGLPRLADLLDGILIRRGARGHSEARDEGRRARVASQARVRRGYRLLSAGHLARAEIDLAVVDRTPSDARVGGLGHRVDALTWLADLHKVRGEYSRAITVVDEANAEWPYANHGQRSYAMWKRAEIRLLSGEDIAAVSAEFDESVEAATRSGDMKAAFWALAASAGAYKDSNRRKAETLLARAGKYLLPGDAEAHLYKLVLEAELARIERRRAACRAAVAAVKRAARGGLTSRPFPFYALAAQLIQAEFDASEATNRHARLVVAKRLARIEKRLTRLGALSAAARAEVSCALARGIAVPRSRSAEFRARGWLSDARRARSGSLSDPWNPVL
jgi:hypothetical protein